MPLNTIAVCGAGTMGSGIAQAAAQHGFPTILFDINPDMTVKALANIEKSLSGLLAKGKISEAVKKEISDRLTFTNHIGDCQADIVIEAILENLPAKVALFNELSEINGTGCIFATNTSSLSVASIAQGVASPSRVIGMHFFNPATHMKLVEIVVHDRSADEVTHQVMDCAKRMGKTPVLCRDHPGFIVNHVARPYYIESLRIAEEGLADVETIDRIMESRGFRMGPFRLMDLIGNDVNYTVSCSVYEQLGKPSRLEPSLLQRKKVEEGHLGKKSGQGYYHYE